MNRLWKPVRHRRRERRIAVLGGRPYDTAGDVPLGPFAPRPVDEAAWTALIERFATGLAPDAVDEATDNPLNNLINALADHWGAGLRTDYAEYLCAARLRLGRTDAVLRQQSLLHDDDRRRLLETQLAVEASMARMGVPEADLTPVPEPEAKRDPEPEADDGGAPDDERSDL